MEVVAWRWSMLSWLDVWHVIELFVVVLSMGFALGFVYAKNRPERGAPLRCEFCTDDVNPQIFPYKRCSFCEASPSYHHGRCCLVKKAKEDLMRESSCSCRTIATQSQCTYKRKLLTPRFHVVPEGVDGGF